MNRDVKIGIVISILVFLVLVLFWSTRRPKEAAPSLETKKEISLVEEPEWIRQFEEEREAVVEMHRPVVEVEELQTTPEEIVVGEPPFPAVEREAEEEVSPVARRTHIIQKGDILWKLAERYYGDGNKWPLIQEANKEIIPSTNALKVGLAIVIPASGVTAQEETEGTPVEPAGTRTYVIKRGDLLWNLAVKFYGDGSKWKIIHEANKAVIPNPNLMPVGQQIVIPELASGGTTSTST